MAASLDKGGLCVAASLDKGGLCVAASLDDTARGLKILPRTDPLQPQEGMYWPLKVYQGCMLGRLLGV